MAVAADRPSTQRSRTLARREALTGYLFIAPYILIAGIFTYGLLIYVFYISFTNMTAPYAQTEPAFVGLANYMRAFRERDFLISLVNAFGTF
ncbi:MAG: hypothetical protein R3E79_47255 [Caldilineaceae bacterium]